MKNPARVLAAIALLAMTASGAVPASPSFSWSAQSLVTDDAHIAAGRNGKTVEIDLKGSALVVAKLPDDGFYGLKLGDIVLKVDNQPVHTTDGFLGAIQKSGDTAVFTVTRASAQLELSVPRHEGFDRFI